MSGATSPDVRLDQRTGLIHVTFATVGDPTLVVARLREELAEELDLAGQGSYAVLESAGGPEVASKWRTLALPALALCLAVCVLAGWVPYDFDDSLLSYILGALLFGGPLCLSAYLLARRGEQRAASESAYGSR